MEVYSFRDAVGYFEEEQILERQAKNIIEQEPNAKLPDILSLGSKNPLFRGFRVHISFHQS